MILSPQTCLQNRYSIVNLIARGGMGAVYEAIDQRLGNQVALKQILVNDADLREWFEQEARLLASLQHPSLPVVSDHFSEADDEFLVMQYIPGDDLGKMMAEGNNTFAPSDVVHWADQLLDALEYLHGQKPPVLHRDIKPRNLKLTSRQDIMLLDFGLARGSQMLYKADGSGKHKRILTPQYAPLEQIQGGEEDSRSDLYALAATLYHLLTGKAPADALTRAAAVLSEQLDPLRPANQHNPQVPPALAVILHQAMSHSLEQRFATATAMRTALSMVHSSMPMANNEVFISSSGQTTVPVSSRQSQPKTAQTGAKPAAPIPANTPVFIVSRHEQSRYQTISQALADAMPGTRILVRPGLYHESLVIDKSVEIIGDGPMEDIFIESTEASCITMLAEYAVVRGLTLRGRAGMIHKEHVAVDIPQGRLIMEDCDISSDTQACLAIHGVTANPVIWRCLIHDGKSMGVLVYDHGEGVIEECDIFSNTGAGVEIKQLGNPFIRRCKIHHGERDGVLVHDKGVGIIERCDIFSNGRAGVAVRRAGNPIVRLCTLHDQLNGYGVYVHDKGEGSIEGCNIFGNSKAGLGITQGGNPLVRRSQIHHEKQRGVFIFEYGEGNLERCYILANADTGITIGQGCQPTIRRCHINQNGSYAIRVLPNGGGMVEDCSLSGNTQGAWDIAKRTSLQQQRNSE